MCVCGCVGEGGECVCDDEMLGDGWVFAGKHNTNNDLFLLFKKRFSENQIMKYGSGIGFKF